ncbi:MAG: YdcF family protein [Rivularia sp. ALOHA_DT_140]|nr:YdcF family protein [Rivularia sp. ALOHA_DT_140]
MLDPALCHRPVSQWLEVKSAIANLLMTPILIVLPLLFLIFLPWIFPRFRWKRLSSGFGTVLLAIYFSAQFPLTTAVANKGLVAFVPPDRGQIADAIVVLGRGETFRNSRVKVAANLWESQRAPIIFASGSGDGGEIVNSLKQRGIPSESLNEEHCSRTTKENAIFTASLLQPQGIKKIILVTDPPHMLRSLLTFRNVGFKVIPHQSPTPHLNQSRKAMMMIYEYMGLVKYGLKGELAPQNMAKQNEPQIVGQRLKVKG